MFRILERKKKIQKFGKKKDNVILNKNYEFNFQKLPKKYEFNFEKRLVTKNSDFILIKKYEIWYNCERIEKKRI